MKRNKNLVVVSLTIGLFLFSMISIAQAASVITSTFDTDIDGWWVTQIFDDHTTSGRWNAYFSSTEGLPNGSIYTPDVGLAATAFSAPVKFLGDKADYVGGSISYDIRNSVAN